MNSETLKLVFVWFIGVVAFFVLWAVLLKVIKRISEKKEHKETALRQAQGPEESETEETNL